MKDRYRNLIVCGDVVSVQTTLSRGLAKKLDWEFFSAGEFFRQYSRENNIPLWDKSKVPDDVEREVDSNFFNKILKEKHLIFDTHYGAWFARNLDHVFRILLICNKDVATQRLLDRKHTHRETPGEIEERRRQFHEKFKKLYGDNNYEDPKYFHLVIDTTVTGEEDSLSQALRAFNDR